MADVTTIEIDTPAGPIDALLDIPEGQGPWPGVVVVHDAIGYGPDKQSINSHVAAAGYVALTPNMFARGGLGAVRHQGHARRAHQAGTLAR